MSSPGARQRRRREQYQQPRSRAEVMTAAGAGVGIVAGTALMIWLLRPGGLADRQPRASWLFGLMLAAFAITLYLLLRPSASERVKRRKTTWVSGSLGFIVIVVGVLAIAWPGGLLRHTQKAAPIDTSQLTTPQTAPPSTAPTATAAPGAASSTTPSTAPTATTTPTATSSP